MATVAYFANRYPVSVEPYVGEEIRELRNRGVHVIAGSARRPETGLPRPLSPEEGIVLLHPIRVFRFLRALAFAAGRWDRVSDLMSRILGEGNEPKNRRLKALLHTWMGACYALCIRTYNVQHIHVHHGYFGSWIAMVAARLLKCSFSLTLHGSDLLVNKSYLDAKLRNCSFCMTVSEYNRAYLLKNYPSVDPRKIVVSRLGVDVSESRQGFWNKVELAGAPFRLLAVGRLHAVKDHAFLIQACARLRDLGCDFHCVIAGEGPERKRVEHLIHENSLQRQVDLLGHIPQKELNSLYDRADVVVLTSRSEGIPLVLMEAMARGRIVLAPAITGIPELVLPGKTGFLYTPGVLTDFIERILAIQKMGNERGSNSKLLWTRHAARVQVRHNFNRKTNLNHFCDLFLQQLDNKSSGPDRSFA